MKLLSSLALAFMIGSASAGPCADIANGGKHTRGFCLLAPCRFSPYAVCACVPDGKVDIEDLLALLGAYGEPPLRLSTVPRHKHVPDMASHSSHSVARLGSKDAGKNIVGGITIDIEDLLALLGQYGSKCSRGGGGKTFCRNYNTGNTGRYEAMGHPLGGKKAVTFDVQARNDAHQGM